MSAVRRILELVLPVRWPDGRIARFGLSRSAWTLMAVTHVLNLLSLIVALGIYDWLAYRWLFVMIPGGILLGLGANARLRKAVEQATDRGLTQASTSESDQASFAFFIWVSGLRARALEHYARRFEASAAKLLAHADSAYESGDQRSAKKYRRRAARERYWADKIRSS